MNPGKNHDLKTCNKSFNKSGEFHTHGSNTKRSELLVWRH